MNFVLIGKRLEEAREAFKQRIRCITIKVVILLKKPATIAICRLIILLILSACNKSDVLSEDDFEAVISSAKEEPTTQDDPSDKSINSNVGNIIEFGGYSWRVLAVENRRALILSENILELRD